MRRLVKIIAFHTIMYISANAELPVDFFIQSEYKKDTIDYSSTERYFFREKLSIFFSQESLFNLSYIYLEEEKKNKYTWNLVLKDISPNASFLLGNYFAQFGTGLLIGKKRLFEPDIFENRIKKQMNVFTPCKSGNPVYAFNGGAGTFFTQIKELELSLNLFYSIKERFTDQDSYESGAVSSTMDTLDNTYISEYNHNELVEIHTKGIMISAAILKHILSQVYFLMTDLRSLYREEMIWEYNESYYQSCGISDLCGYGVFSQYKDDFLSFLIDWTVTRTGLLLDDNIKVNKYGYGVIYGLEFTPPFLSIGITGKEVDSSFYSPYSSSIGEDYPESAWFLDAGIKPYSNLKFISGLSSQKKTRPSSTDYELPVTRKEKISIVYSYGIIDEFDITLRRRERIADENEEKLQIKSSMDIAAIDPVKIKFSTIYQRGSDYKWSKIFGTGFEFSFIKYLKINAHYVKAYISGDNTIYTVISPIRDSATQGFLIKQDSDIIIIKPDFKLKDIYLSCRYLHQYKRCDSIFKRLEFYASAYF